MTSRMPKETEWCSFYIFYSNEFQNLLLAGIERSPSAVLEELCCSNISQFLLGSKILRKYTLGLTINHLRVLSATHQKQLVNWTVLGMLGDSLYRY